MTRPAPDSQPGPPETCPEDQLLAFAETCPEGQLPTFPQPAAQPSPEPRAAATPTLAAPHTAPLAAAPSPAPHAATLAAHTRPDEPSLMIGATTITLHPVLRTALLVAWAALSGPACKDQDADPVRAAQAFTAAVQSGDMKAVLPLLEKAAADRLADAADQASDQVGGRRRIEPAEMLQIVDVSPTFELARTELVDNDGATAHVQLHGAQQESYTLTLVHEDGAWHVRIPTP